MDVSRRDALALAALLLAGGRMALKAENPVVGGTFLRRAAIQSPNYVAGVSGWAIFQNGSAEFNNGTFRGIVTIGGTHGTVTIADGQIELFPPAGTPNAPVTLSSPQSGELTLSSGLVTGLDTAIDLLLLSAAASPSGSQVVQVAGGALVNTHPGTANPETWQTSGLTLPANWSAIGPGIRYKLLADGQTVRITVNATIAAGAVSGTISLGTLPAAYRPAVQPFRGCAPSVFANGTPNAATFNSRFNVTTGGVVQVLGFPGGANPGGVTEFDGQWDVPLD